MYSFSGLSLSEGTYGCWRKAWFRYGLDLRGASTPALDFGKASHGVIAVMIQHKTCFSQEAMLGCLQASMDFPEEDIREMKRCINADAVHDAISRGGNVEEYFEMPLDDMPFSPSIRGYIDYYYIEDKIYLFDWKTNRAVYNPADTYQLGLYARYLSKKHSLPVVGNLAFLRFNQVLTHEYTEEDMEEARLWALDTAVEYDIRLEKAKDQDINTLFPKQPGKPCEYCGYRNLCLDKPNIPEAITSPADAIQTLEGVTELKEYLKAHEENLKAYIRKNGSIQGKTLIASLQKNDYLRFDLSARKAVVQEMLNQNLDIGSILKIGSDAQKDLRTKYGWSDEDFINLGAKKGSTTRLSINKVS